MQSKIHTECKPSVIKLEFNESDDEIPRKELLMVVDFNEFILPFICSVGKLFYFKIVLYIYIIFKAYYNYQCS